MAAPDDEDVRGREGRGGRRIREEGRSREGGGSREEEVVGGRKEKEVGAGEKKKQLKVETAERLKGSVQWTINCSMISLDATEHSPAAASSPRSCSASCRRRQARTFQQNVSALTCIRHETSYSFPSSSSSSSSFIPSSS
eukprot:42350-Hanusia_phi.AAC.1